MTPEEAQMYVKGNVRTKPAGRHQHFGRARLLALDGRRATIQPFGHRDIEVVDVDQLAHWKAGNPELFASKPAQPQNRPQPKENPMPAPAPTPAAPVASPTYTPELYMEAMIAPKTSMLTQVAAIVADLDMAQFYFIRD